MRGTRTVHSSLKLVATLAVASAAVLLIATPATASEFESVDAARTHVKKRALSQLGTRYSYGGESPRSGFDCSGLMYWTFKKRVERLPRSSDDQWALHKKSAYKRVRYRGALRVGDLVFFTTSGSRVSHSALYIGRGRIVHSSSSGRGVRRDSIRNSSYYRSHFVGGVRVPDMRGRNY
jgi:cell wall-associated NlpC family hydrolase